jgi:hypothetical protein
MSPAQNKAWDKLMEAEYSALYWQYAAANLGRIVTALNVVSALTGASAVALLITDYPILTKIIALVAAGLTLFVSYSGFQQRYEKAKIRTDLYSKMSLRYERLWNRINLELDEKSISDELDILLELEAFIPAVPDEEYNDQLRERAYKILVESKEVAPRTAA